MITVKSGILSMFAIARKFARKPRKKVCKKDKKVHIDISTFKETYGKDRSIHGIIIQGLSIQKLQQIGKITMIHGIKGKNNYVTLNYQGLTPKLTRDGWIIKH
jgi:hypothetical protein